MEQLVRSGSDVSEPQEARRRSLVQDCSLCYDRSARRWVLSHSVTLETVFLPAQSSHTGQPDEYLVHFDEEGFGVVGDESWQADIDDVLELQAFED
eukprot:15191813-Alexandrium_andersonii.AAC.1